MALEASANTYYKDYPPKPDGELERTRREVDGSTRKEVYKDDYIGKLKTHYQDIIDTMKRQH